jgi:hypothetical protein
MILRGAVNDRLGIEPVQRASELATWMKPRIADMWQPTGPQDRFPLPPKCCNPLIHIIGTLSGIAARQLVMMSQSKHRSFRAGFPDALQAER